MRLALLALLIVFLGVVGVIYAKAKDRERVDAKVAAGDHAIVATPSDVHRHYMENVVGADNMYLDKLVELDDATVVTILKTQKGSPYLGLDAGGPEKSMVAFFDDELSTGESEIIGHLRVGQKVTLQCVCKGLKAAKSPDMVMMHNCHVH